METAILLYPTVSKKVCVPRTEVQKTPQSRTIYSCTAAVQYCHCVSICDLHFGRCVWYLPSIFSSSLVNPLDSNSNADYCVRWDIVECSLEILWFDTSHGFKQKRLTSISCCVESVYYLYMLLPFPWVRGWVLAADTDFCWFLMSMVILEPNILDMFCLRGHIDKVEIRLAGWKDVVVFWQMVVFG